MLKAQLILLGVKILMGAIALGIGIWYLSSSIGGAALTYTSVNNFMTSIGVENGDIASANGCFMCGYIADLFSVIGSATERFWNLIVGHLWLLVVIGFGVWIFIQIAQYMFEHAKKSSTIEPKEQKIEYRPLLDKIWKQALRLLVVGTLIGALGMGGTAALKTVSQVTITPVLYVGAEFSMMATGVTDAAQCGALDNLNSTDEKNDFLNPVLQPFMCVMGNINSVMLAGAAGGFAMMNYAWLGLGGGVFTWIAGLVLVLMFLIIGFDLFFQILSVIFKLIFIIIFLPFLLVAAGFEGVWSHAGNLMGNGVNMLISSAVKIIAITLKVLVLFATVSYAADSYFPGPNDGYSAILPPLMWTSPENPDAQTLSVMNVFSTCERVALRDGEMDADLFKDCFTAQRATVERQYPNAFDFLSNGWDFLIMMAALFFLYFYAISPKIDKLINYKAGGEMFDYGTWIKDLGKKMWEFPVQVTEKITKAMGKK